MAMNLAPISTSVVDVKPEQAHSFTPAGGLSDDPVERLREKIENLKLRLGQIEEKRAKVETTLNSGSGNTAELEKDRIALLEDSLEAHRKLNKKMDELNRWELKIAALKNFEKLSRNIIGKAWILARFLTVSRTG